MSGRLLCHKSMRQPATSHNNRFLAAQEQESNQLLPRATPMPKLQWRYMRRTRGLRCANTRGLSKLGTAVTTCVMRV